MTRYWVAGLTNTSIVQFYDAAAQYHGRGWVTRLVLNNWQETDDQDGEPDPWLVLDGRRVLRATDGIFNMADIDYAVREKSWSDAIYKCFPDSSQRARILNLNRFTRVWFEWGSAEDTTPQPMPATIDITVTQCWYMPLTELCQPYYHSFWHKNFEDSKIELIDCSEEYRKRVEDPYRQFQQQVPKEDRQRRLFRRLLELPEPSGDEGDGPAFPGEGVELP